MGFKDFLRAANHSKQMIFNKFKNASSEFTNKTLHVSALQNYPMADALPLPINVDPSETTRFSPQRSRDISAHAILSHQSNIDITFDSTPTAIDNKIASSSVSDATSYAPYDPHVESYDCFGSVSLNSSMQSNVPSPFGGLHKFSHLNMPGGQWSQEGKFMSNNLHSSHYTTLRRQARASWCTYDENATIKKGINNNLLTSATKCFIGLNINNNYNHKSYHQCHSNMHDNIHKRLLSSSSSSSSSKSSEAESNAKATDNNKLSRKEKLKKAVKEYGGTVIVFHVGISLISLGLFYTLVSSGIDLLPILEKLGLGSSALSSKTATGAGTFVIAYAIHKVFAPVRISITLGATPFIVRYLRNKGFLKPPVKS